MAWEQKILACSTLYLPNASEKDIEKIESLGFHVEAETGGSQWRLPETWTKELVQNIQPPITPLRPHASREIHHVYKNQLGESVLWTCVAAVNSDVCMCFGEQSAISTTGPVVFKAKRHIHKEDPPNPPPTAEELAEHAQYKAEQRQRALEGDKRALFMIGMWRIFGPSVTRTSNICVMEALAKVTQNQEHWAEVARLKAEQQQEEQEYEAFMEQCKLNWK